jgi:nucleoid-associated protein YgaU
MPFLRTPAAPALLAMGIAVLGLVLLAQDRHQARSIAYAATVSATPGDAGTVAPEHSRPGADPAAALARADAAGLLTRGSAPIIATVPAARPATYAVQPGEDLPAIAAKLYGDPAFAPRIAAANPAALANGLPPGTTLLIPSF